MEKILTVPEELKEESAVYCTGNDYVSISNIGCDGWIRTVSHLRDSTMGLIEYDGDGLFGLFLNDRELRAQSHGYAHDFIPEFFVNTEQLRIRWQIYAPEGIRGFGIRCTLQGKTACNGTLKLIFRPDSFIRTVFHPRSLGVDGVYGYDSWSDTLYLELVAGAGISALAIGARNCRKHYAEGQLQLMLDYALEADGCMEQDFFVSFGPELDGARLANVDMQRRGKRLFADTVQLMAAHHICLPDPVLEARVNLNLNFCRYFSVGRTLDTDRLVLLTSRSGRYYVSGAYWARDCMLWAFPALLQYDSALARDALLEACTTYLKDGARHALYINGVCLYPGFELDQLVAPIIALERYVKRTEDADILTCPQIRNAMAFTVSCLKRWWDTETGLFATELSPSDDPCEYPYLTYDNFLVLAALRFMAQHMEGLEEMIHSLEQGIWKHCVAKVEGEDIFVWACDGKGGQEIYDNPPGSLMLIPYYGGCEETDPVWRNTLRRYFSRENPWYTENELLFGQGCEHAPSPWPMSLCNLLLSRGRDGAVLDALRAMEMDNGIACETVKPDSGRACTGAAFATFAGFYANALVECHEN